MVIKVIFNQLTVQSCAQFVFTFVQY